MNDTIEFCNEVLSENSSDEVKDLIYHLQMLEAQKVNMNQLNRIQDVEEDIERLKSVLRDVGRGDML